MYGPVPRMLPSSIGVIGVPLGTGQLNGIVRRARNEAGGSVSLKVIVLPSTVMPDTASALPAIKASAPSIAVKKPPPGDALELAPVAEGEDICAAAVRHPRQVSEAPLDLCARLSGQIWVADQRCT